MSARRPGNALLALLVLVLALSACLPGGSGLTGGSPASPATGEGAREVSPDRTLTLDAHLAGSARGPAGLVADNSIGLVADNAIGLVADNSIGLVADNAIGLTAPGYRIAAVYPEEAVPRALVFLSNPDGQFYVGTDGQALAGMTDAAGDFAFPAAPSGTPVVVNVMLGQERRLVGFLVPRPGGNRLLVNMASSLVTEYLRDQARRRAGSMAGFDLSHLERLHSLTQAMLDRGGMGAVDPARNRPDLRIAAVPALVNEYAAAIAGDPELAAEWQDVLGYRPLAIELPFATSSGGLSLVAIAPSPDGSRVALGLDGGTTHEVWLLSTAELAALLAEPRGTRAPDALPGRMVFLGTSWSRSREGGWQPASREDGLSYPYPFMVHPGLLAWAPDGKLLLADDRQADDSPDRTWIYRIDPDRAFPGNFDRLVLADPLSSIKGMAFDPPGNLYLADWRNHTVRRIAAAEAAGPSWPGADATASWPCGDRCRMEVAPDRVATATVPVVAGIAGMPGLAGAAGQALLDHPRGLAWDGAGILVADAGNRAIRRLRVDAAGHPGVLEPVAGGGAAATRGGLFGLATDDGAVYGDLGFEYPYLVAVAADGRVAVGDDERLVLLEGGRGVTLLGPFWATFPDGGDSRRALLPGIEAAAWFGSDLLLGTFGAPVLARVRAGRLEGSP